MAATHPPISAQVVRRGLIPAGVLGGLLVAVTWGKTPARDLAVAVPVFLVLYGLLFSLGQEAVAQRLREWVGGHTGRALALPVVLVALLYGYCAVGGGNPLQGTGLILPSLLLLPILVLLGRSGEAIAASDFAALLLLLIPLPGLRLPVDAEIPFGGGGFDTATRVVMVVTAVYAFVVIRGLPEVGAVVAPRLRPLATTLWVWLVFFALCFVVGSATGFVTYVGHGEMTVAAVRSGVQHFVRVLLHTALFEELFFRGLLQNMVAQRIAQAGQWRPVWRIGLAVLLPIALVAGLTLGGAFVWLPATACGLLFAAAYWLERRGRESVGAYTALALVGSAFGLVHYHAGSVVFVSLAIVAGWAYGYLYLHTRNLLYPTLAHALINNSPLIFGLALVK